MTVIVQEVNTLDLLTRSRKFILQRSLTLENSLGLRLSYARWLLIVGLFIYHLFNRNSLNRAFTFSEPIMYLLGVYAGLNLLTWLITLTVARTWKPLVTITLLMDVAFTAAISYLMDIPLLFFAFVPALLILMLVGLGEGVVTLLVIGGINIYYVAFDKDPKPIESMATLVYGLIGSLLVTMAAYFIITQSTRPMLRVSEDMLEEALARANESHLTELQNRAKAVYRVANTLSSTLDYQQIIKTILHEMEHVFDVWIGAVLLFEGSLNNMRVEDALRLSPEENKRKLSVQTGVLKKAVSGGKPVLVTSSVELGEITPTFPSLNNCRSAMLVPMRAGMEVFGLMIIGSKQENAYGSNDVELMVTLSAHCVIAMQNATLYRNLLEDRNKLIKQEEEVRHELARNLHDGPAQAVAAISMQTEFIRRLFRTEPDRALDELANLGKQAQQTSREIRTLLYELRPLVLESHGLIPALEQYAKRFPTNPSDPQVHFSSDNFSTIRLSPQVETTIFAIMQEAVNNARKHARARNLWLHLEAREGFVLATAQDDGRGFDVAATESDYSSRGSLGMTNMKERASMVGGQVELRSAPGQGTAVILRIPMNEVTLASTIDPASY